MPDKGTSKDYRTDHAQVSFVGDGTGVGKGRVLAGIIADNWNQDRQRAIWLSVNNDLLESARRDGP